MRFFAPFALTRSVSACVALTLLSVPFAHADDDNTPLSLSLSHSVTRDSNFARSTTKQGETINVSAARLNLDKAYGRQVYRLSTGLSRYRYAYYGDRLNNDGKDYDGSIASEFGANWVASLNGSYNESLNPIENNNNGNRVSRNIRTYRDGGATLQYGNGGRWALVGSYDVNRLAYSDSIYTVNNAQQKSTGLKVNYNSTDLLVYGLGVRSVRTQYPNRLAADVTDKNVDLTVNWQVTGLSNLNSVLTRRTSTFSDDSRQAKGFTGRLNWNYTPSGLFTYGVGLSRTTGTDRTVDTYINQSRQVLGTADTNLNNTTTSLNLSAQMRVTGKVRMGVRQTFNRYEEDNSRDSNVIGSFNNQSKSNYRETALTLDYDALRTLNLGCSLSQYKQTQDRTRPEYDGRSVGCNARFTLDSF